MKKNIKIAAMASAMMLLSSCVEEKNRAEDLGGEYVEVTLGDVAFDFTESGLTKGSVQDGLYGIQVYKTDQDVYEEYACWLTDDLSSQSLRLLKDHAFLLHVVYVPNGKELLYSKDGVYGLPFKADTYRTEDSPVLNHDIYYGDNHNIKACYDGAAQGKDKTSGLIQSNYMSDIVIYNGNTTVVATEDMNLSVKLYRFMFGLSVKADNLKEGKVHVYNSYYTNSDYATAVRNEANIYTLTPEKPYIDKELEMPYGSQATTKESMDRDPQGLSLRVDYEYPDGKVVNLIDRMFDIRRMTRYTLSFDLEQILTTVGGSIGGDVVEETYTESSLEDALRKYPFMDNVSLWGEMK